MKNEAFFDFPINVEKELKSLGHKSWNESVKILEQIKTNSRDYFKFDMYVRSFKDFSHVFHKELADVS